MNPDLTPATDMLARVITGISDEQLTAPTPCRDVTVAALLDHVDGLSLAFAGAAAKDLEMGRHTPSAEAARLVPEWQTRIPERLTRLAAAWRDDSAWAGLTRAGGIDMPAEVAGAVAINEVVVHGWDLAVATGQGYACPPDLTATAHGFVQATADQAPDGTPGLFGPPVAVPDDAPLLDRLLGLTGRDPAWRPAAGH